MHEEIKRQAYSFVLQAFIALVARFNYQESDIQLPFSMFILMHFSNFFWRV